MTALKPSTSIKFRNVRGHRPRLERGSAVLRCLTASAGLPIIRIMRRSVPFLFALLASSCVTLTPAGARVSIYNAPLDGPPALRAMPDGCQRLNVVSKDKMTESAIEGQATPFAKQQNASAAAGGNVLLVLKQQIRPRRDPDCPASSSIRDCHPSPVDLK